MKQILFLMAGKIAVAVLILSFSEQRVFFHLDSAEISVEQDLPFYQASTRRLPTWLSRMLVDRGLKLDRRFEGQRVLIYRKRFTKSETGYADVPSLAETAVKAVYLAEAERQLDMKLVLELLNEFMSGIHDGDKKAYREAITRLGQYSGNQPR